MCIKKPFVLFEILIALSLMATMICLLFSFMVQSSRVGQKMENARAFIFERQHFQIRMQDLLTSLTLEQNSPALYTKSFPNEQMSLIVHFDNGIDPDPSFSGHVIGKIYVDETQNFCLVYWPTGDEKKSCWRKEVLFSKVSDFSMQFLKPNPSKGASWTPFWTKEEKHPPSIVRLHLKQKDTPLQFAFRLPNINAIPTYTDDLSPLIPKIPQESAFWRD